MVRRGACCDIDPGAGTNYDTFSDQRHRLSPVGAGLVSVSGSSREVFNLFNTVNLARHSVNIANPAEFGQPAARFTRQVFGSGGGPFNSGYAAVSDLPRGRGCYLERSGVLPEPTLLASQPGGCLERLLHQTKQGAPEPPVNR